MGAWTLLPLSRLSTAFRAHYKGGVLGLAFQGLRRRFSELRLRPIEDDEKT